MHFLNFATLSAMASSLLNFENSSFASFEFKISEEKSLKIDLDLATT